MIPPLFDFLFLPIVANKFALNLASSKVLNDIAPRLFNFFSQYSINSILDVPDTVLNFIKSDKILTAEGNTSSIIFFCVAI